jgi:hypothetical protein
MKKHFTAHIIFAATALASQQVWALGFGRAVSDAVLGQTLTFTVPINVEPGERLGLDCVSTQVFFGEALLLPNAVRADLQRGAADNTWLLKITTITPVEEPIIEVAVSAGCERRFTRRFSVFADPPTLATSTPQSAPATAASELPAGARAQSTDLPPIPAMNPDVPGPLPRLPRVARHHAGAASAAGGAHPRVVRAGPTMALANELNAPAPGARRDAGGEHKPAARTAAPVPADTPRLVLDPGVSHLKLDMEDPIVPPPSASGASIGLSDLDDPEARQLRSLEQSIQAIRRDKQVQLQQAAKLQAELQEAQARSDWLPWLFGMLLLALAAIVAMWWKLRQQTRIAHSDWFNQSQLSALPAAEPAPAPAVPVVPATDLRARKGGVPAPAVADDAGLAPSPFDQDDDHDGGSVTAEPSANTTTRPLDRQAMASVLSQEDSPRELSVEELLDLEQQADFFIALGQEDAAVDLLMSHLRSAGGQSPLPYTKLLEIYRRQDDRSAYERTRARFNRRFNAYAPDWDTGPAAGRSLEDYPETIALLEGAWSSPIDAMAILEGLLFKRDDTSELFDLPAYRDVLVLYSLARDLWQHGDGGTGTHVDVLLPLLDDPVPTMPMAIPAYPSAREMNDLALPATDAGLDLESVDVEGDTGLGLLTSFEMTGFDAEHDRDGRLKDLAPPSALHASLDALSLAPVASLKPKPSPHDWREGESPDSEAPTKR